MKFKVSHLKVKLSLEYNVSQELNYKIFIYISPILFFNSWCCVHKHCYNLQAVFYFSCPIWAFVCWIATSQTSRQLIWSKIPLPQSFLNAIFHWGWQGILHVLHFSQGEKNFTSIDLIRDPSSTNFPQCHFQPRVTVCPTHSTFFTREKLHVNWFDQRSLFHELSSMQFSTNGVLHILHFPHREKVWTTLSL